MGFMMEGNHDEVSRVKDKMVYCRMQPNLITYTSLVHGTCKYGEMEKAVVVVAEMIKMGCEPNCQTYCWLIEGYCQEHNMGRVLELVSELEGRNLAPSVVTYSASHNCEDLFKMTFDNNLFKKILAGGFKPSAVIYKNLVVGYAREVRVEAAKEVLDWLI